MFPAYTKFRRSRNWDERSEPYGSCYTHLIGLDLQSKTEFHPEGTLLNVRFVFKYIPSTFCPQNILMGTYPNTYPVVPQYPHLIRI